jgi:hypothetical protein
VTTAPQGAVDRSPTSSARRVAAEAGHKHASAQVQARESEPRPARGVQPAATELRFVADEALDAQPRDRHRNGRPDALLAWPIESSALRVVGVLFVLAGCSCGHRPTAGHDRRSGWGARLARRRLARRRALRPLWFPTRREALQQTPQRRLKLGAGDRCPRSRTTASAAGANYLAFSGLSNRAFSESLSGESRGRRD